MTPKTGSILPTGLATLDAVEGGLRRAALTELSTGSGAGTLFRHAMVGAMCRERCFGALVDAAQSFEPEGIAPSALARLLLVFYVGAIQAVKATDLLLRDGNLALVMLDLQAMPLQEAQRIPANTWHRLQRLAEQSTTAVVVLTAHPMVEAAQVRITAGQLWTLAAQRRWRRDLTTSASWQVFPRRVYVRLDSPLEHESVTA